jgi:hypothetical protein
MSQTDAIRTLTEEEYRTFDLKRNGEFNYEIGGKLCLVRYVNGCRDRDPQADEPILRFIEIEIGEEEVKRAEHSYRQRERERNWPALDDGQIARMVRDDARALGNKIWEKNRKKVRAKPAGRKTDYLAMAQLLGDIWKLHKKSVRSWDEFMEILKSELSDPYKLSEVLKLTYPAAYPREDARNHVRKLRNLLGME